MITGLYAGLSGLLFLFLSSRVVSTRRSLEIGFGDQGNKEMAQSIRVHANFSEYVPLTLLLIFFVEQYGAEATIVHGLGGALIVARILHAWGLGSTRGLSFGRFFGTLVNWIVLAVASSMLMMNALQ